MVHPNNKGILLARVAERVIPRGRETEAVSFLEFILHVINLEHKSAGEHQPELLAGMPIGTLRTSVGIDDGQSRIQNLTRRERQIMDLLVLGKTNKTIAYELGISQKTVDFHRANILDKAGVDSVVELLRLTQKAKLP